ncbi:MAG: glycosyltransferase 61 family protein [Microcoleaceae cyanobacterium]
MNINHSQKQAFEYLAKGEYSQAINLYENCIEINPTIKSNYWYLGLALLLQGEEFAAKTVWLSAMTEATPDNFDIWMTELIEILETTAIQYLNAGKLQQAEKIYWQILEVNHTEAKTYYNLGNTIAYQGREEEAIECWEKAVELQPDFLAAYQSLASLFQRLREFQKAISYYLKMLEIQPNSLEVYENLGLCFSAMNYLEEARAYCQLSIKIQTDYSPAWGNWGIILLKQGKLEEAIARLKMAIEIQLNFIQAYLNFNQKITSHANLFKALQNHQDAEIYLELGRILVQNKSWQLVVKDKILDIGYLCLQKAREVKPELGVKIDSILNQKQQPATNPQQNISQVKPPTGFYESTWEWAVTQNVQTSNYINIYPENFLQLKPPITPDNSVHFSFRFGNQIKLPATFVAIIPEGRFWIDETNFKTAIITSENQENQESKILGDVSPQFPILSPGSPENYPSKHSIFSLKTLPQIQNIQGTVAVLSGIFNNNYFHWMFDILPRIELLRQSGINFKNIDKFLINHQLPFQKETLKILDIPEAKIIDTEKHQHIQATKLIVPSFPGCVAWMPKWACDFLRTEFLNLAETSDKIDRIYISRKQANNRRIINEDEIINLLTKFGFKSVTLESMSVKKQASLLANAKVVISAHGGGLTNLVFCHPGTKVIEIFSPNYIYSCYWLISNLVGLEYYYLLGENPLGFSFHELLSPNHRLEDIFVNINHLLEMMKFVGIT